MCEVQTFLWMRCFEEYDCMRLCAAGAAGAAAAAAAAVGFTVPPILWNPPGIS